MNVVKALPPLVIEEGEIERFAAALDEVIGRAERLPRAALRFGASVARRSLRRRG
jgi:hypothetical protein